MFSGDKSDKSLRWDFPGDVSSLISDNSWKQSRRGLQMMQMWPRACRLAILLSQQLYILNLEECICNCIQKTVTDFNVLYVLFTKYFKQYDQLCGHGWMAENDKTNILANEAKHTKSFWQVVSVFATYPDPFLLNEGLGLFCRKILYLLCHHQYISLLCW